VLPVVLIRPAIPGDAPAIARVHVETWQTAYRGQVPEAYLASLDIGRRTAIWTEIFRENKSITFVAEIENKVIGFCSLMPSRDEDANKKAIGEIAALYVSPRHWRRGAGRRLGERALAEARNHGWAIVTLWVLQTNTPAQVFYEQLGFVLDGVKKMLELDGHDLPEVRYRRML